MSIFIDVVCEEEELVFGKWILIGSMVCDWCM